ncbi:MAG: AroM family protein [Lachnospiraceae bacterium]|nr:AroM family protein [Lachnospiraceae bacterium]
MIDKPAIGLIAMGKKENRYLWQDLIDRFGPDADVMFRGVLDGFEPEEIREKFAFSEGDHYIVTELPDKSTVHISERAAREQVSRITEELFNAGAAAVLVLCTGDFERSGTEKGLLVFPEDILFGLLSGLKQTAIGFIVPEEGQIDGSAEHYAVLHPIVKAASPYGPMEKLRETAASFREEPVNVIVTDCMGFTAEMGQLVSEVSGKLVLVPRVVIPKLLCSMIMQK